MAIPDVVTCYRAVQSKDARFDGWFFTAVRTTGIYCRPSCPAIVPRRENVEFHASAAAAQLAGYRACKRCRPDSSPGSPEWDTRADVVARAMRLIRDGEVERAGVAGLARRLGYSERQLNRALNAEVGAGALSLSRARRAQTSRVLLETTELPVTEVAFAAGFTSVRQFNDTVRDVFAQTPSDLRRASVNRPGRPAPGVIDLRLPYRAPLDLRSLLAFHGAHAVPLLEEYDGGTFTRVLDLPGGPALVECSDGGGHVRCRLRLAEIGDLMTAVSRVRRLLDLDADPAAVTECLSMDKGLAPTVTARPGLRSPGSAGGFEMAVRAIAGQQISLRAARVLLGKLVARHGTEAFPGLSWRRFPSPQSLAETDPETLPMPRSRARALQAVAGAFLDGSLVLDAGTDRRRQREQLLALPGVGPWTADTLLMRAMGDPDVLLASDLVARKAAATHGIDLAGGRPDWAPWRSYATHYLWASVGAI